MRLSPNDLSRTKGVMSIPMPINPRHPREKEGL